MNPRSHFSLVFGRFGEMIRTSISLQILLMSQDWVTSVLARRPERLPASHRPLGALCSLPSRLQVLSACPPPPLMTGGGGGTSPAIPWFTTCRSPKSQVRMLPISIERFLSGEANYDVFFPFLFYKQDYSQELLYFYEFLSLTKSARFG